MENTKNEIRVKQKKPLKEWLAEDFKKDLRLWLGFLIGAVVGYAFSYFILPADFRRKIGFFDYLIHFNDMLFTFEKHWLREFGIKIWISTGIGSFIGVFIEAGRIKACTRKKTDDQCGD